MLHLRCGRGSRWSYGELNIQPQRTTKGQRQGEENSWHTGNEWEVLLRQWQLSLEIFAIKQNTALFIPQDHFKGSKGCPLSHIYHVFYLILPTEPETHMFAMFTLILNPSAHCPLSTFALCMQENDFCFLEVRHEEMQVPELNNKATWKATETVCLVIIGLFFFKELQVRFRGLEGSEVCQTGTAQGFLLVRFRY